MSLGDFVLGLDIGQKSWACVRLPSRQPVTRSTADLQAMRVDYASWTTLPQGCRMAMIDVPIGLLSDTEATPSQLGLSGYRSADKAAKKWCLSGSSIFVPPTAGQFQSGLKEFSRVGSLPPKQRQKPQLALISPKGLSAHAMNLIPAIQSAARLKIACPDRVFESHPEAVFAALAGFIPPAKKGTLSGMLVRARILGERLGFAIQDWVISQELRTGLDAADWLDALAMALVAQDWVNCGAPQVLRQESGEVSAWQNEPDRIIALPHTRLKNPPRRLTTEQLEAWLLGGELRII